MKRLLFLAIALAPVVFGQKREDILSIQRDVANLQDQVRQLQKAQDDKFAAMQAMLQPTVDAAAKLASGLTALQRDVDAKLNDQQGKVVAPVATLNTKVDQMSDDFRSVATSVADLVRRMNGLDTKLADIKAQLSAIQNPPQAPAPAQTAAAPPGPCAGVSAETLWEHARGDQSSGKLDLALQEYGDYVKCFHDTENAPNAQYQRAQIYYQNQQYEDAAQAFDDVSMWPENPKSQEALYYKAVSLQKGGHKTDAAKVSREYLDRYPRGDHVQGAHANLRSMGMDTSRSKKRSQ